ncbi:MAG: hypothetical protein CK429_19825, partial [Mycobacterium sp.]
NYQGLAGFTLGYTVPQFPAVGGDLIGGVGPITVLPPIQIPSIPLYINTSGGIGPVSIPSIPIPSIHLGVNPTVDIGPVNVGPFTISTPNFTVNYSTAPSTAISGGSSDLYVVASYALVIPGPIKIAGSPAGVSVTSPGFTVNPISILAGTATFPGFTIPLEPIHIGLPLSLTIPGSGIPGGGIPSIPLNFGLNFATPAFGLPTAVIDRIPLELHVASTLGPIEIPIAGFGGTPGFWNTTSLPSSGFFNIGGGGGSGFWNSGSGLSGFLNAISDPLLGSASGALNYGTQLSGLLNRGAGMSGVLNTSTLDLITQAFNSGWMNVGQRLSGLIYTGTGP